MIVDRAPDRVERLGAPRIDGKARCIQPRQRHLLASRRRQHRLDLVERQFRRLRQRVAAQRFHQPGAQHQRFEFVAIEHDRGQIEAAAQLVADARFALDRHAAGDQIADVAVDGALGNVQPFGELARGERAPSAEVFDELKQAVGAAHRRSLRSGF